MKRLYCSVLHQAIPRPPERDVPGDLVQLLQLPFHESVAAWERKLLQNALKESGGIKADAARQLGIEQRLL